MLEDTICKGSLFNGKSFKSLVDLAVNASARIPGVA